MLSKCMKGIKAIRLWCYTSVVNKNSKGKKDSASSKGEDEKSEVEVYEKHQGK